jgi:hypothetical protein
VTADDDRIAYLAGDDVPVPDDDRHDLDGLRGLLADPGLWVDPDPLLEDRIVAAIAEEASADGVARAGAVELTAPAAPGGSDTPSTAPVRAGGRDRTGASRRWSARKTAWSAVAAAAVVVAILGGVFVLGSGGRSREQFSLALAPTELVPAARGHARLTRTTSGWRIELDATGLPRLDGGKFYEAWLKNDAGVLVPVGTFNEGANVTLWAGVSPRDFRSFTVTEEEADGNQASSGRRVLVGSLPPGG